MTNKCIQWSDDLALPKFADRETCAAIISHYYFPIKARTIATWPLVVRKPNRSVVYDVREILSYAETKFNAAPKYKQA